MVTSHVCHVELEDTGLLACGDFKVGVSCDVASHICGSICILEELGVFKSSYSQFVFVNEFLTYKALSGTAIYEGHHWHTLHGSVVCEWDLKGVLSG